MYDPRKPMPKQLEAMPETDEEKTLIEPITRVGRVDSGLSHGSDEHVDIEKEETWPLDPEKSAQVLQIRPSRPWSEMPQNKKGPGLHAM
jgi:hypothetical protein